MLRDINSHSLRSVDSDDFMPPLSLWTRLGGFFLVSTVLAAVSLASVIKYKVTVKAPAIVRPVGELRIVQAATEGTIQSIEVKENQQVERGDPIVIIDDSGLVTQKSQLQEKISQSQQQLEQIEAQIRVLSKRVTTESLLKERNIASAKANLNRDRRDYQDRFAIAEAEMQEASAALALAKEELKRYQQLAETGAVAQLQIEEKKQAFKAAEAKVERARAMLNPDLASVEIAKEQIAQEKFRGQLAISTLDRERENLINEQIEIQKQLNRDRQELQQLEREIKKTTIEAPSDGKILQLQLRNSGQIVRVGDTIARISPQTAPLFIKAQVAAKDISKVSICSETEVSECELGKVQMRFSTYPYPDYGVLLGAVRNISADTLTTQNKDRIQTPKQTATNASYYEVTIEPVKHYFMKNGKKYFIQSGMEVNAEIISREETVMKFMLRKARLISDL